MVDAQYGFGNGRVIPAGPLREPVAAGLARADAIVLLGDGPAPEELLAARRPVLHAELAPVDPAALAGRRVVAFAGIARPEKFFASLAAVGAEPVATRAFADHHPFAAGEIARLRREAEDARALLVTTAKDLARLAPAERDGIAVLEVEIAWREPEAVLRLLSDVVGRARRV